MFPLSLTLPFEGDFGDAGRETSANNVGNPSWLPNAADPGAAHDANADAATEGYHDSRNYDREYEGYEGYAGYGEYEGYGYDAYGYDGYYDLRYCWQDTEAANEGSSSPPAAAAPPSAALVAGGAGLSSLDKAPSPMNDAQNEQEIGDGGAERKPRPIRRNGTGAGAVHLPPIGGVTGAAMPPRPASR